MWKFPILLNGTISFVISQPFCLHSLMIQFQIFDPEIRQCSQQNGIKGQKIKMFLNIGFRNNFHSTKKLLAIYVQSGMYAANMSDSKFLEITKNRNNLHLKGK